MRKFYFLLLFSVFFSEVFSQNYTALGNSSISSQCNCFQLTPNSGGQAGAIFQNNTINLNNSFDFTFSNFFGCNGASGADGEAFVLTTNPNGLGNQGEGLGYGGSNQPCSFAIEFDTWQNGDHNDPSYDHTAFESGGSVDHNVAPPVPALASGSNLDNCQWHTIEIVWDVNTQTMYDYVDGSLRISLTMPGFYNTYLCGNPIVNWGWTGSTGGGWNLQQVCIKSTSNWVAGVNYQSCSTTVPFSDVATTNPGNVASWQWLFGDGGSSTQQNPTHTYPDTGTYNATLILTDVSGCKDSFSHPVHIVAPITLTPTLVNPLCNGAQTGSITLAEAGGFGVSAGNGGFRYSWSDGTTHTNQIAGVGAGTYTVTITDGVCSATGQYTLNQPTAVTASTSSTASNCGQANGTCSITISGGTPPYQNVTFAGISGTTVGNTTTVSGFLPGTYIANFSDANGCSALLQYSATVANLPCGVNAGTSHTNVTCFGGSNGSVTLAVTGGSGTATITWTNSSGTTVGSGATVSNLPADTYTYSYSDANPSNAFTGTITVTQPGAAMVISLLTSNVSCAGQNNGSAIVSVTSGGASPFTYTWSGGQPNNPVASNLGTGPISVTVTDANGCTATASGTITTAPPLQINVTSTSNACSQGNNGTATANVTGGTPPYRYMWSNISSAPTDLSLAAGTYTVTVTDSLTCSITGTATITSAAPFINVIDSTNVKCYGDSSGTITVHSSGGTSPYTYSWSSDSTGTPNPNLTGGSLTALKAGEYLLTVTDGAGCTFFDSTFLSQPATPLSLTSTHTNVTCYGQANGSITVTLAGGTPPYTYQGQTVPPGTYTQGNLPPGIYPGAITDANGCSAAISDTITSPQPDSLVVTHVDNICFGAAAGSATANFVNPSGVVGYNWSNTQTTATISNLVANTYSVTATDANGCSLTGSAIVNQPTAIAVQIAQTNVGCYGATTGSATLTTSGGTGPNYTYTWSPNVSSTNTATNMAAGTYNITISDQNACALDTSVVITQPAQPLAATYVVNNVSCFGGSNGSISATVTGGTPSYTYAWTPNNVSSSATASNLAIGSYSVTVTDLNSCTVDSVFTITQPATAVSATGTQTNPTCYGSANGAAYVTAAGGTAPYAYGWSSGGSIVDSATNLLAGSYIATVTDNNGCTVTQSYTLTSPPQIVTSTQPVNITCYGQSTGSLTVTASGGAGGFTYAWTPNVSTTNTASNLAAGTYTITVTDATSCTTVTATTLSQPAAFVVGTQPTAVTCFGQSNGSIVVNVTGGTAPYTYGATDGTNTYTSATGHFSSLPASTYVIVITDQNGCADTTTSTVNQPALLTEVVSAASPSCSYLTNGVIQVTASGGTQPYTYAVTGQNPNTSGLFTGLAGGNYNITVTDQNGCDTISSTTLVQPDTMLITIVPTSGQVKLGDSLAITTTTNQTGSLSYSWTPNFGLSCYNCQNPVFNGVYSQPYNLVVTNDSGCVAKAGFTVTVIPNYDFFIPNAFTPNGDGKDDYWQLYGNISAIKQLQVMVFDRWGEKVFESNEIDFKWDGTFKGKPLPLGVYVYAFKLVWLDNHSNDTIKGGVTILK